MSDDQAVPRLQAGDLRADRSTAEQIVDNDFLIRDICRVIVKVDGLSHGERKHWRDNLRWVEKHIARST